MGESFVKICQVPQLMECKILHQPGVLQTPLSTYSHPSKGSFINPSIPSWWFPTHLKNII